MRPITSKEQHKKLLAESLDSNLDNKCHNVIVCIEERMAERIEESNDDLQFYIADAAWYGFMNNAIQHQKMREWISRQYECNGWKTRWWHDTDNIGQEWKIILS